jgi:N-acylglucosamine-6-phosphate 2-epimerase
MLPRGLIVSCQIPAHSPLLGKVSTAALAIAAESGGAVAIRAQGFDSIKEIKEAVSIPVIGLIKTPGINSGVYINSTISEIQKCVDAGSDYIAIDATGRPRAGFTDLAEFVQAIKDITEIEIIGDVSTIEEGKAAAEAGISVLASTLAGYTESSKVDLPDLQLISDLVKLNVGPVIAEGGYRDLLDCKKAFDLGAHAICIGSAITDPWNSTKYFVNGLVDSHAK